MLTADINYSIFHFFGDNTFIEFVTIVIKYLILIEPSIKSFPNKKQDYYESIEKVCTSIFELIVEFVDPVYVQGMFRILIKMFQDSLEEVVTNVDTKMLYDETALNMVHTVFVRTGTIMYEEVLIDPNSKMGQKCIDFREKLIPYMKSFVISAIEASFSINYSNRISNTIADIVLTFLCIDKGTNSIMMDVREWLQQNLAANDNDRAQVDTAVSNLLSNMKFSIDAYNRESFYKEYKTFCEYLIKEIVRKNSTTVSINYIDRMYQDMMKNSSNDQNLNHNPQNQDMGQIPQTQNNAVLMSATGNTIYDINSSTGGYPQINQQM